MLDGHLVPGQARELLAGGRLIPLDHGDVVGVLGLDEPGDVRLHRVQGVEGDQSSVQVQRCEQAPEVRGLVRLRPHLRLGEGQGLVVGDRGEQMPAASGQAGRPLSDLPSTAIVRRCPGTVVPVFRPVR